MSIRQRIQRINFKSPFALAVIAVTLIKVLTMTLFASHFSLDYFLPFISSFSSEPSVNPYQVFHMNGLKDAFPYPAGMLFILSLPYTLFSFVFSSVNSVYLDILALKLPILIMDFIVFWILLKWSRGHHWKVFFLYWASPVIFYINSMLGQLDVIPIAFLLLSIYHIFNKKVGLAGVFFGIGLACKTNILLAFPFLLIFIYRFFRSRRTLFSFIVSSIFVFLLVNAPFLMSVGFIDMVFNNAQQGKVLDVVFQYTNDLHYYFLPGMLLILLIKAWDFNSYTRKMALMMIGFAFGITLLFVSPSEGWMMWLLPFLVFFNMVYSRRSLWLFLGLNVSYLLLFALTKESLFLNSFQLFNPALADMTIYHVLQVNGINANKVSSLCFTLFQTFLLLNGIHMYMLGIQSYARHQKILKERLLIGIGGDSGVGKTTISGAIERALGEGFVTMIRGDDMHKWERGHEKWNEFTHLNPKANQLHEELNYLKQLKMGKVVHRRHYDHTTGKFTQAKKIKAGKVIIFEGLHPFYLDKVRALFDLKVFIQPAETLATHWKVCRDRKKRGYTTEMVLEQIKKRDKDRQAYIQTQAEIADVLIEIMSQKEISIIGDDTQEIKLKYAISISNSIEFEAVVNEATMLEGIEITHSYEDGDKQKIEISGQVTKDELSKLSQKWIPALDELGIKIQYPDSEIGVVVFLLLFYIFNEGDYAY